MVWISRCSWLDLTSGDDLKPCCSEKSGALLEVRTFTLAGRVVHIYPEEDSVAYRTLVCVQERDTDQTGANCVGLLD